MAGACDSAATESVEVLPHAVWTLRTWRQISTQWVIVGGMGVVAHVCLRHEAIPEALEAADVPVDERLRVRRQLRIMERAALEILNESDK